MGAAEGTSVAIQVEATVEKTTAVTQVHAGSKGRDGSPATQVEAAEGAAATTHVHGGNRGGDGSPAIQVEACSRGGSSSQSGAWRQ